MLIFRNDDNKLPQEGLITFIMELHIFTHHFENIDNIENVLSDRMQTALYAMETWCKEQCQFLASFEMTFEH